MPARGLLQVGGEEDPESLGAEAGRAVELRELFQTPRNDAQLLFQFTRGRLGGTLARVELAPRQLQHELPRRGSVLAHKRDAAVREERHDRRPARMFDELAYVGLLALAHGVADDTDEPAAENFLARQ